MTLYYVYLKFCFSNGTPSTTDWRWMATFESRYVADEFFRKLVDCPQINCDPRLKFIKRETPQFWCFGDDGTVILSMLQSIQSFREFDRKVMMTLLNDGTGGARIWPVFPNLVDGPDWVSGNTFFIRNKRQPQLYWAAVEDPTTNPNPNLIVSTTFRSKFRVHSTEGRSKAVLIREDRVTVSLVSSQNRLRALYVVRGDAGLLALDTDEKEWKFGDFFTRFGSVWVGKVEVLSVNDEDSGLGDEWEFC